VNIVVEFVKGKALFGPILILIGGIVSLLLAVFWMVDPLTWQVFETNPIVVLPMVILLIVGIVFVLGGYFAARGNMYGNYLAVILGIILVVLWVFVLQPPPAPIPEINYYLVGIGPIVILVGGILGFFLKE